MLETKLACLIAMVGSVQRTQIRSDTNTWWMEDGIVMNESCLEKQISDMCKGSMLLLLNYINPRVNQAFLIKAINVRKFI